MKFDKFVKNASKDLDKAIKSNSQNLDIWEGMVHRNAHKVMMLPYYIQYKILMSNRWLIYATWALAIGTLILSGLAIYFQYLK